MTDTSLILYGTPLSGHAHRAELMLRLLGLAYRYEDGSAPVRRTPAFLALNPLGQIPILVDGDLVLPDSNAILVYLARRYDPSGAWYPDDMVIAARIQRWLSMAAGEVRYGPAKARVIQLFKAEGDLAAAQAIATQLLVFMDGYLADRAFLAHHAPTIADVACYSYIAHAPEGGIPLDAYAHVRGWLGRVESLPGFVPMPRSPVPD
ncbi:glutathione S-transferase family protein [Paramagnetospirillum magneticum]|nr:glutathione S-transferase [Paramagnetospirillum magneticum]